MKMNNSNRIGAFIRNKQRGNRMLFHKVHGFRSQLLFVYGFWIFSHHLGWFLVKKINFPSSFITPVTPRCLEVISTKACLISLLERIKGTALLVFIKSLTLNSNFLPKLPPG